MSREPASKPHGATFSMHRLRPSLALMANILYLFPIVAGHSWVDELTVIAKNGTFIGDPGYPRGYVPRETPGFSDLMMQYLLPLPPASRPGPPPPGPPKVLPTDNMCRDTQMKQVQSDGKPRLKAPPGSPIALRYQENGHVTLPSNTPGKPDNRGTVYVYGTTDPKPDDKFASIHKVWNKEGTGGDRRGMLLSMQDYDDGRCYQINDQSISKERQKEFPHEAAVPQGQNLWCQHDLALPANAPEGKPYTLYWVWDWPTIPDEKKGIVALEEIYTTCMDIDIAPASNLKIAAQVEPPTLKFAEGQDLGSAAIPTQFENLKAPTIPDGSGSDSPPPSSPVSTEASQQSVPASEKQEPSPSPTPTPTPPPASEPETRPDPAGNSCGIPPVPVTAPQIPDTPLSSTPPAIIPLFPYTPVSGISRLPSSIPSPESSSTDNNGGSIVTIFPGTLVFPTESSSATPSPTPTIPPEQAPTNPGSGAIPLTPSTLPSSERDTPPSPSRDPLFLTILDSSPATAVTATDPPGVSNDVVAPSPPSTPGPTPTPSGDDEDELVPVALDPEGNLYTPSRGIAKTTIATPTTLTTIHCTEDSAQPPKPTELNPESSPPAIIPIPPNRPSNNNSNNNSTVTNSQSNALPTIAESPTSSQPEVIISTITVTATKTVFPTAPPDDTPASTPTPTPSPSPTPSPTAEPQVQEKAQTEASTISQSSGFIVSIRPSPSSSETPPAAELPQPQETSSPDCESDGNGGDDDSIPTPTPSSPSSSAAAAAAAAAASPPPAESPTPLPSPPAGASRRAFRTLSSRFRRNLAEIRVGGQV
ncbi:hypothetical protein EMPG_16716 [Blastomyces silverae]|uniref:DUF7492 domain-containing protein n=1 Tax=Blastomyces silverae TaxID=2060906 RepID=A0A0H1B9T1_9EURO|nr:hypothetical protein EMPG_16716 [Blastomyces silverae]